MKCSVKNCDKEAATGRKGFCTSHYKRNIRYGNPEAGAAYRPAKGEALRWAKEISTKDNLTEDCIKWPFGIDSNGYGVLMVNGRKTHPHRYICELVNGIPREGNFAAHSCGKGHEGCVNPKHLRWATPKENSADRLIHGTDVAGEKSGQAKLTNEEVQQVRYMLDRGYTQVYLAELFGVHQGSISRYKLRKCYKNC